VLVCNSRITVEICATEDEGEEYPPQRKSPKKGSKRGGACAALKKHKWLLLGVIGGLVAVILSGQHSFCVIFKIEGCVRVCVCVGGGGGEGGILIFLI
jgi:hypothetical protein